MELNTLLLGMTDTIWVLDAQGCCLKVASTRGSVRHAWMQRMPGKTLHEVFHKTQADEFLQHLWQVLTHQRTIQFEYNVTSLRQDMMPQRSPQRASASVATAWFAATVSPLSDDTAIWVAREITSAKRLEEQRRRAEEETQLLLQLSQRSRRHQILKQPWRLPCGSCARKLVGCMAKCGCPPPMASFWRAVPCGLRSPNPIPRNHCGCGSISATNRGHVPAPQ
ncbi:MAG: hypothetical protein HC925_01240 [Coleofasciculaceae cyanobacterium SM2_3_26]|nr:hypothetical protein [Coleofasciculaceae cyanobacterium SM2_3_26]